MLKQTKDEEALKKRSSLGSGRREMGGRCVVVEEEVVEGRYGWMRPFLDLKRESPATRTGAS